MKQDPGRGDLGTPQGRRCMRTWEMLSGQEGQGLRQTARLELEQRRARQRAGLASSRPWADSTEEPTGLLPQLEWREGELGDRDNPRCVPRNHQHGVVGSWNGDRAGGEAFWEDESQHTGVQGVVSCGWS